ncbi:MAG: glycyl radical protein [Clostridiales bacterium]|jgi:formate C-acetyltransferase|nr:glycyl radical protein [Clostridiales bacterium]
MSKQDISVQKKELSPQEKRLLGLERSKSDGRVERLLAEFRNERPSIDIERGKFFTESFRATEGQPLVLRWAKALYHYAKNATVYIDDGQLIVGRAGKQGRYGILYPELDGDFLDEAIKALPARESSPFDITPEDARTVIEEISPYWKGKTFHEALAKALPEDTFRLTYNADAEHSSRFIVNETASFRSSIQWVHDYEKPLRVGFAGIRAEATAELNKLDEFSPIDNTEKKPFLEAVILTADAIVLFAERHAIEAEKKAKNASDPLRKKELKELAEICRNVPKNPPKSFREAVQSQWFIQLFSRVEQKTGTIISNGRMDQYLYPFFKADKEKGILTDDAARELLECVWVAMAQYIDLYLSKAGGAFNEGYAHWEAVTIGGQTPDGRDAVNELTYLFLKSKREFPLNYPDLAARIHTRSPKRYLHEVALTVKDGSGFPKLINDEEVVPLLLSKGASFSEAYDYSVSGCAECRMPNRDTYTSPCAYINFAAAVEMTLFNGKMLKYGDEVIGLRTGEVGDFKTFDEFLSAYLRQQKNFLKHAFIQQHEIIRLRSEHFASPLGSGLHALCMREKKDIHSPHIAGGIDLGYFEFIGYGTVIDSLAAIKKLVFEEKTLTLSEIKKGIEHNFEGYETLRARLKSAPTYGNDDPYADEIGRLLDREALDFTVKYSEEFGVHLDLRLVPFTSNVPFGKVVAASPNGRKAYSPLSDGSSASQGADVNGPTAVLLSNFATKNYDYSHRAARLLNLKLSPSCVAGDSGTEKLVDFIEAWRKLKLWHLQFNVINRKTLLDAQKDPEAYRNLLVRVAGYSAYFCELSKDLQDDMIARTEHVDF